MATPDTAPNTSAPYTVKGDALWLSVRVSPRAAHNKIAAIEAGQLKLSVTAVPEKGKANKAVIALLAKRFHLPRSAFVVQSGALGKDKKLSIECTEDHLKSLLAPYFRKP